MKYVSIDIESSGLESEKHCVLSIGAIIEDTTKKLPYEEIPKFNAIVLQNEITGSPRALTMNQKIIQLIGDYLESDKDTRILMNEKSGYKFYEKDEVIKHFFDFLFLNGFGYDVITGGKTIRLENGRSLPIIGTNTLPITITVAGKNFGTFDKLFLVQLPWWKKLIKVRQRIADPAILYTDWINDETLPNLTTCKTRANVEGIVTHDALEDAWDVIQVLRKKY